MPALTSQCLSVDLALAPKLPIRQQTLPLRKHEGSLRLETYGIIFCPPGDHNFQDGAPVFSETIISQDSTQPRIETMALLSTPLLAILATIALFVIQFTTLRLLSLAPHRRPPPTPRKPGTPAHLLIVLGSGGHTAEVLSMLRRSGTCQKFTHRTWLVSSGDNFSAAFAVQLEQELGEERGTYRIVEVRRARKIHQSLISAPWSCLLCLWDCLRVLVPSSADGEYGYPDLILTNGPATATILVFASVLLRFFGLQGKNGKGEMRTIYVESWARVKKLSLSGRLLCWVVDRVLVQWEQLQGTGARAEFHGVLV